MAEKIVIDWSSFQAFVAEFKEESDRAAVVLGAAKLDSLLAQILDRFLLPSLSTNDELLEGDSPLATFSSRINACYRLGLISSDFAKSLHLVRKIRNAFAHETSGCSLTTGSHSDRLKSLLLPLRHLPFFIAFQGHFFKKEGPSAEFRACLSMMAARLESKLNNISQVDSSNSLNFIRDEWKSTEHGKIKE